ncbi:VPLPA-CTERM sorting domain-containing protein [Alkalilimnicola ehrlichii]|nr:VPLPA-CTERM sorting domain-containing protein [Alkalilimnicola ehrlichii]
MKIPRFLQVVACCLGLSAAGLGHASVLTYQFGEILSPESVDPAVANVSFATLTVDTETWTFRLSADDLSGFGSGAFVGALAIGGDFSHVDVVNTTPGGGIQNVSYHPGGGPGGVFDFRFDLTGPRQDRLTDGEWVEWTVQGLYGLDYLALHVRGIDTIAFGGSSSAWYGAPSPIPLPASVWLLGSALVGFAAMRRRQLAKGV